MVRGEAFECAWVCILVGQPLSPSTRQDVANSNEPKPVPNPVGYWIRNKYQHYQLLKGRLTASALGRNVAEQTETDLLVGDWPHTICRAVSGDGQGDRGGEQPPALALSRACRANVSCCPRPSHSVAFDLVPLPGRLPWRSDHHVSEQLLPD